VIIEEHQWPSFSWSVVELLDNPIVHQFGKIVMITGFDSLSGEATPTANINKVTPFGCSRGEFPIEAHGSFLYLDALIFWFNSASSRVDSAIMFP
jgi:hypothetical protein